MAKRAPRRVTFEAATAALAVEVVKETVIDGPKRMAVLEEAPKGGWRMTVSKGVFPEAPFSIRVDLAGRAVSIGGPGPLKLFKAVALDLRKRLVALEETEAGWRLTWTKGLLDGADLAAIHIAA
jgi:hypothetical protein